MKFFNIIFIGALIIISCSVKKEKQGLIAAEEKPLAIIQTPYIERIDSSLNRIIAPNAEVEIIAEGFDWTEGPLWIEGPGLLFSDIPPNKIFKWTEEFGVELYLFPSGYTGSEPRGGEPGANGLLIDQLGNLILCQHGDRRIAMMNAPLTNPKAEFSTVVDNYKGKKFNSPNDACLSKDGVLFFTDPPYGLEELMADPKKELDFQGVFCYSNTGELTLLTKDLSRPNGIGLSPDEHTLFVSNSDPEKALWMKYALNDDGTLGRGEVFYDATPYVDQEPGLPDGLKVDKNGNIFATGPGGVWIFDAFGKLIGKIKTGQATSNCAFGNNEKVLYITADMYIMKVNLL